MCGKRTPLLWHVATWPLQFSELFHTKFPCWLKLSLCPAGTETQEGHGLGEDLFAAIIRGKARSTFSTWGWSASHGCHPLGHLGPLGLALSGVISCVLVLFLGNRCLFPVFLLCFFQEHVCVSARGFTVPVPDSQLQWANSRRALASSPSPPASDFSLQLPSVRAFLANCVTCRVGG